MKIVILDPYFESLGGGEKVVVVMAEYLAKTHEVTILVKNPVKKDYVNNYFDVDLDKVNFEQIPNHGLLVRLLTNRFVRLPGRWKSIIYDRASLQTLKKMKADLFINSLYQSNLPSPAAKSIYICMFPQKLVPANVYHTPVRRLYNSITNRLEELLVAGREGSINSYSLIASNSKYTAGWVKKYWGRDSLVLYPVCDDMGPPMKKKKIILSVGRFFADNGSSHHKRHGELISAFIRLAQPDWELHLAGSITTDADSKKYLNKLKNMSKNHANIFLHPNMPFDEIKKLRQQSSIYWHATGLGYDADIFPENQEHFGMVTVEAMSAGVVPVVYNSAGQKEVVSSGKNGFLWDNVEELLAQTKKLINEPELMKRLEKAAITRASDFDRDAFHKQIDDIMEKLN